MIADQLEALLDGLDAFLYVPDAFARLRGIVVDLAMAGQLVKPEPQDGTVEDLLTAIADEKSRLKLKAPHAVKIQEDESADIPSTWALVQLGDLLMVLRNGTSATPNDTGAGYPLLRISAGTCRADGLVDIDDYKFAVMSKEAASQYIIQEEDLLVCRFNGNMHFVGRAAQVPELGDREILHPDKLICLRPILVSPSYLKTAINSPFVRKQIESVAATTAGNIGINGKQVKALLVPLPPLGEQERIAQAVDDGLRLIDELQKAFEHQEELRSAILGAKLLELETTLDVSNLDDLADLVHTLEDLRRVDDTIVNLGVSGKLAPNGEPEPDEDLLITEEPSAAAPRRRKKKQAALPPPEVSFEVPSSWSVDYLGDRAITIDYGYTASSTLTPLGPKFVRITDLQESGINWDTVPYCKIPEADEERFSLASGDLLFARTGGTVGKSHLYLDDQRAVFASYLIRVRCGPRLLPEFAAIWFGSPQYWRQLRAGVAGTGQPNFNGTKLSQLVLALPPVEEQGRIVSVVDELLAITRSLRDALAA